MDKSLKAGYTIECALVMPIVLVGIMGIIFLTIYMYDSAVIKCAAINSAMAGLYVINEDNKTIRKAAEDEAIVILYDKLIAVEDLKVDVSVTALQIKTSIEGTLSLPGLVPDFGVDLSSLGTICGEYKVTKISGGSFLRNTEKVSAYTDLIKDLIGEEGNDD